MLGELRQMIARLFGALFGNVGKSESDSDATPREPTGPAGDRQTETASESTQGNRDADEIEPDSPASQPGRIPRVNSPLTYSMNEPEFVLDVAVYQTRSLTSRFDRIPEQNIVRYLGQALRDVGYNYRISFAYPPVSGSDDASADRLGTFSSHRRAGRHLNLLLADRNGGGLSYLGGGRRRNHWTGRYAIAPAGNIDRMVQLRSTAPRDPENERLWINLRAAALHEPGHSLGGTHADGMTDPRWQGYPQNGEAPSFLFHNADAAWFDSPPPTGQSEDSG